MGKQNTDIVVRDLKSSDLRRIAKNAGYIISGSMAIKGPDAPAAGKERVRISNKTKIYAPLVRATFQQLGLI